MVCKYLRFTVICEIKLPMQELELKCRGAYAEGGVITGFYGSYLNIRPSVAALKDAAEMADL